MYCTVSNIFDPQLATTHQALCSGINFNVFFFFFFFFDNKKGVCKPTLNKAPIQNDVEAWGSAVAAMKPGVLAVVFGQTSKTLQTLKRNQETRKKKKKEGKRFFVFFYIYSVISLLLHVVCRCKTSNWCNGRPKDSLKKKKKDDMWTIQELIQETTHCMSDMKIR